MRLADIKTTEWLLINWGRWAYCNRGLSINFPAMEPYERMAHERMGEVPPEPKISDSDAQAVDRAIAELCAARPKNGETLARYYLYSETYRGLGKKMGMHHQVIAHMVGEGKMWVEGRLIGIL